MESSLGYSSEFSLPNPRDPFDIIQSEKDSLHTGLTPISEDQVENNTPQTQSVPVIET